MEKTSRPIRIVTNGSLDESVVEQIRRHLPDASFRHDEFGTPVVECTSDNLNTVQTVFYRIGWSSLIVTMSYGDDDARHELAPCDMVRLNLDEFNRRTSHDLVHLKNLWVVDEWLMVIDETSANVETGEWLIHNADHPEVFLAISERYLRKI